MCYHSTRLFSSVLLIDEELQFIITFFINVCGFIALDVYDGDDEEGVARVVYRLSMIEIEFSSQHAYADVVDACFCHWSCYFLSDVGKNLVRDVVSALGHTDVCTR
jgi:hypothetical protein